MTEAVEEQGVKKAAPVGIDPDRLAATFADFGLGVPAAVTELLGGGARSFRIDREDGQPVVPRYSTTRCRTRPAKRLMRRSCYATSMCR